MRRVVSLEEEDCKVLLEGLRLVKLANRAISAVIGFTVPPEESKHIRELMKMLGGA